MKPTDLEYCINDETGKVDAYAWPGGYPLFYQTADGGVLCPACVQENLPQIRETWADGDKRGGWYVDSVAINYEEIDWLCDHCSKPIPPAYPG